jgi:hypothetical protein
MDFNQHTALAGKHAFLSPSSPHWLNYNGQKLEARYFTARAARRGSDLHNLAKDAIRLGIKIDRRSSPNIAAYVADGIQYKMNVEQPLLYSENCFGTADTICFRRGKLRVHDLKTGITKTSFRQLEVYAALFCLEYDINPFEIEIELRIYQREDMDSFEPMPEAIATIMEKIIDFDRQIESLKEVHW